jgi:hypothetical protein
MTSTHVNRRKQLSKVLSIRMTDLEFRRLQETLRNYEIRRDSISEAVRVLLSRDLHRSRRFARALRKEQSLS